MTFSTAVTNEVAFSAWMLAHAGKVPSWKMLLAHVFIAKLRSRTPIRFMSNPVLAISLTNKCPEENAIELGGVETGNMNA